MKTITIMPKRLRNLLDMLSYDIPARIDDLCDDLQINEDTLRDMIRDIRKYGYKIVYEYRRGYDGMGNGLGYVMDRKNPPKPLQPVTQEAKLEE